jgi:hypothetical protein
MAYLHSTKASSRIRRNFIRRIGKAREKDTKTHPRRRISLGQGTVELLATHRFNGVQQIAALGVAFNESTFVFLL